MTRAQRWILHFVNATPQAFPNAMLKTGHLCKNTILRGLQELTRRGFLRKNPELLTVARQHGRPQRHYYKVTRKGRRALLDTPEEQR